MKKLMKVLTVISAVLAVIAAINRIIFFLAELERKKKKSRGKIFEWKYGKISYTVKGHGKPILLVHGLDTGSSRAEWEASADILSQNYMVYSVDLLGFGESQKPNLTYSSYLYSRLIADFIGNVIKQPVFAAACRGGAPVLLAACKLLPAGKVKKIVLVSPSHYYLNSYTNHRLLLKNLIKLPIIGTGIYNFINSKAVTAAMLKEYGYYNGDRVTADVVNRYYYPAHYGGANAKLPAAYSFGGFLSADAERLAGEINIPIRCVAGGNDKPGLSFIKKLLQNNNNITVSIFQNARALPHEENPGSFTRTCRAFFGG